MPHENPSLDERLSKHPQLRNHVLQLLEIAESDSIEKADEAEEQIIKGVRGLGKQVLEEWAHHQEQTHSQVLQNDESARRHVKKLHWMSSFGEIALKEQTYLQEGH